MFSSDGKVIYDIKNNTFNPKDGGTELTSIFVIQEDKINTITLSYENLIFFIILKLDSISNSYDIKEHIFEFNSFYSKNLFNSNKTLLDGIKKNLKRENIMNITEKEDIFDEIFNLNFLDDIKNKKESNIIKLKENDTNIIQYILFLL